MHEDHTIWQLSFAAVPGIFRSHGQDFPAMADACLSGDMPALFPQRQVINVLRKDFPDDARVFISDSELAPSLKITITFFAVFLRLHFFIPEGALLQPIMSKRGRYSPAQNQLYPTAMETKL